MRTFLILALTVVGSVASAAERVIEQSIAVNPDVRFSLDSHRGRVEITTADVDHIRLEVRIRHEDEDVLDRVEIDVDSSRSAVSVRSEYDQPAFRLNFGFIGTNNFEYPEIRYFVTLPEQASLYVKGHRSRIDVDAPGGRVEINSHRGDGRIRNVRNNLKLDTHRGNFDIEILDLHDVDIDSHRGNVDLSIHAARDFRLSGESHRGALRFSGLDVEQRTRDRGAVVNHVQGSGGKLIDFRTHRGDITMRFRD